MTSVDETAVPDYANRLRLDGRRFVVVGAGQGIGRQCAHALAAVGARVACVDVETDRARAVANEIDGTAAVGDATRREEAERIFAGAEPRLGGVDGAVDIVWMAHFE